MPKKSKPKAAKPQDGSQHAVLKPQPSHEPDERGVAIRLLRTTLAQYETGGNLETIITEVLKSEKNISDALHTLGIKELHQDNFEGAERLLRQAVKINTSSAAAFHNLGIALMKQGRLEESIASLRRALDLNPRFSDAYNNLGRVFLAQGKQDAARESYLKALELNPESAETYRNYAACMTFTAADTTLADRLEDLLSKAQSDADKSEFHFALGKICDDSGRYDKAFLHYYAGNQLDRKKISYDQQRFTTSIDRLTRTFSSDLFRKNVATSSFSELPIFILGMPRSGTTLIEQIVSSHPLVFGAGELEYFNRKSNRIAAERKRPYPECVELLAPADLQGIAEEYIRYLQGFSSSAVRVTDKLPANFLHLGLIALLFPKARVIHCKRDPLDTCLSIFFQKFSASHPYSFDLGDLGHYYREYERLMEHSRAVLPSGMMLEMQYEDVIERPEEMTRKLIEFCGLEWDESCLKFHESKRAVQTASSWQVRQPIYKTSSKRWKQYEKHLGPLINALAGKEYIS